MADRIGNILGGPSGRGATPSADAREEVVSMVEGWFWRWVRRHVQLCPHERWPAPNTTEADTFYGHWIEAFASRDVTEEQANRTSEVLAINPPRFPGDHLAVILAYIASRRLVRAEWTQAKEFEAIREQHEALCDLRAEWRARWEALPEDERELVRQAVLAEVPAAAHLRSLLERLCIDRMGMGEQGGSG